MKSHSAIDQLVTAFGTLPGVGPRSARRLALHVLKQKESRIPPLLQALTRAQQEVVACSTCGALDDINPCRICTDTTRDHSVICVVEDVADIWAMERGHNYKGAYHVLGGTLSALDGRGPQQLRIEPLMRRVQAGAVKEIILALSATVAGQTTGHYVADKLENNALQITRLAQGIPVGGELDYMDDGTLSAALQQRLPYTG
jgi:recombination protein RecR